MSTFEKIEKAVVEGYKKIEDGVVDTFEDMTEDVKYAYDKIENAVVGKFEEISDSFIEKHLLREGETLEEAKERLAKEQAERIEKSIEASKNAGKR